MMEERSAGAILFRQSPAGKLYLLLNYPSGHWDFVKGNIEEGETLKQTVVREIMEETGITDVDFIEGFEEKVEYHYQRDGGLIHKVVVFFLAETKTEKVTLSHEHEGFVWLKFADAIERLTYKTAKGMMIKMTESGFKA